MELRPRFYLCLILMFVSVSAHAHRSYESYLKLSLQQIPTLVWEIETNNFESLFALDDDGNEIVSWKELRNHQQTLVTYSQARISLAFDQTPFVPKVKELSIKRRDDQTYLVLSLDVPQKFSPQNFTVHYGLFFDIDPDQRLLLNIQSDLEQSVFILSPQKRFLSVDINSNNPGFQLRHFIREGMEHLLIGYDHLAFLLMLVLAQLSGHARSCGVRNQLLALVKLITAFSVAHTLTLFMSATKLVSLPSAWVEVVIALTVMLAALANVSGRGKILRWQLAFVFGLIHGFGFANVLGEINLQQVSFMISLLGFNLGLELAQLGLVLAVFPLLLWLRRRAKWYGYLSAACCGPTFLLSLWWVFQRI